MKGTRKPKVEIHVIMKTFLITAILAVAAIPAFSGSSDQPFTARVPSLGDAKVNCGLAKSVDLKESFPYFVATRFEDDKISYPFVAFAIVEYPGQWQEAQVPGLPPFSVQTRNAKKFEIKLTMPDGEAILASEQTPPGPSGFPTINDVGRRVTLISFWYRFKLDGTPSSFYRFDFFVDGTQICGGTLSGPIWKRDEAQQMRTQTALPQPGGQVLPSLGTRKIAFVSNREGSDQIYVLTAAGTTRLTSPPGVSWSPAFSPDGQKIVFNTKQSGDWQTYLMDADGSHATQLTAPPGSNLAPRFSPDGRQIAFTSSRKGLFQIFTMSVDGSNVTQLTFPPGANLGSSFSPDGRQIAFQSTRDGPFQIYVMNVDGSNSRRLTAPPGASDSPAFSPDGRKIVFDSDRDGAPQIYIMEADGSNVVRLTNEPGTSLYPSFSPDGTKIIFASSRSGSEQVYMMDPDGSNVVPLTNGPGQSFFPVFAP